MIWYCWRFQAFTGDLGTYLPCIREDYCICQKKIKLEIVTSATAKVSLTEAANKSGVMLRFFSLPAFYFSGSTWSQLTKENRSLQSTSPSSMKESTEDLVRAERQQLNTNIVYLFGKSACIQTSIYILNFHTIATIYFCFCLIECSCPL